MNIVGLLHVSFLLIAYAGYLFVTLKSLSKTIPYKVLTAANVLYFSGFLFGMLWAKTEWGFFLSSDIKIIVSMLLPLPYVAENILKTRDYKLTLVGALLMVVNYILPTLMNSIHSH